MNNPETLATLGTHDIGRKQQQKQHKKMSITDHTNDPGVNTCAREGLVVPASFKTPTMLII